MERSLGDTNESHKNRDKIEIYEWVSDMIKVHVKQKWKESTLC